MIHTAVSVLIILHVQKRFPHVGGLIHRSSEFCPVSETIMENMMTEMINANISVKTFPCFIVFLLFLCDGAKVHVECAKSRQNFPRIHDVIIGCTQEDI